MWVSLIRFAFPHASVWLHSVGQMTVQKILCPCAGPRTSVCQTSCVRFTDECNTVWKTGPYVAALSQMHSVTFHVCIIIATERRADKFISPRVCFSSRFPFLCTQHVCVHTNCVCGRLRGSVSRQVHPGNGLVQCVLVWLRKASVCVCVRQTDSLFNVVKCQISPFKLWSFCLNRILFFSLQDPYMFEPNCQMKVDEYGFFMSWKSEGKVLARRCHIRLSFTAYFWLCSFHFLSFALFFVLHFILTQA